jgi:hypothetical protein
MWITQKIRRNAHEVYVHEVYVQKKICAVIVFLQGMQHFSAWI